MANLMSELIDSMMEKVVDQIMVHVVTKTMDSIYARRTRATLRCAGIARVAHDCQRLVKFLRAQNAARYSAENLAEKAFLFLQNASQNDHDSGYGSGDDSGTKGINDDDDDDDDDDGGGGGCSELVASTVYEPCITGPHGDGMRKYDNLEQIFYTRKQYEVKDASKMTQRGRKLDRRNKKLGRMV